MILVITIIFANALFLRDKLGMAASKVAASEMVASDFF